MTIAMQGLWRIAIYNPMLVHQIGYNLTAFKVAHCLNNCSGHGQCDSNGVCQCDGNWAGGDCSVNKDGDCQVCALQQMWLHTHCHLQTVIIVKCPHVVAVVQHMKWHVGVQACTIHFQQVMAALLSTVCQLALLVILACIQCMVVLQLAHGFCNCAWLSCN